MLLPLTSSRGCSPLQAAGEVSLPLASLGAERSVYLGRSIEGVLRHRSASQLTILFQRSYVCIRRFR